MHIINNPYQPSLAVLSCGLPCVGGVKIHLLSHCPIFHLAELCFALWPRVDAVLPKRNRFCSRPAFRNSPLETWIFTAVLPERLPRYRPDDPFTQRPEPPVR